MAGNQTAERIQQWTPEQKMQAFKEGIAGVLALLVVGFTLLISWMTFNFVGEEQKMTDAKDVLLLMLGLSGVVVGYYFGRVPADARAALAQEQANRASAHSEQVSAQAQQLADNLEDVIGAAGAGTRGLSGGGVDVDLAKVREDLRALANFSRTNR